MQTDEEREVVTRLVAGDDAAYAAVFRMWYAPLVRFVEALLRQRDEAEEVVQEVMLELWHHREALDPERPVQAWLFRSARNRALNVVRHRRVRERSAPHLTAMAGEAAPSDEALVEGELAATVHEALAELPPRCREVFELSRTHGLRNAEIAARLGVSVKAVEAHIGRALRTMRERLRPWLPPGRQL
ncbi:MAG TPA: RNA polymerase sigma-70 factor [Gemmatimonadaceae bacterium]|nr:RNA polymerase sigma-70 factor [Gemmatimonadaceae bacterium]